MFLKASKQTEPKKLAGAILGAVHKNGGSVDLQAIGAGAVNQAVKAIAIVDRIITGDGDSRKIKTIPGFVDLEIGDRQITAIRFTVLVN